MKNQLVRWNLQKKNEKLLKHLHLLTIKPILYVANVGEDDVADPSENEYVQTVKEFAAKEDAEVIVVCANIEEEIAELEGEEKEMFLENLELKNQDLIN